MLQHRLVKVLLQLALLAYPFYIWWAVSHWHPAAALTPLALIALVKAIFGQSPWSQRGFFLLSAVILLAASVLGKAEQAMLYYPVWVNGGMLALFGWSLCYPPTVVERLARLVEGELDAKGVAYTRKVTQVWCGFFLLNGAIAALTAWWGDWDLWVLYNGFIAYLLMGLLMAAEWLVRRRVRAT
ncbi:MAG: hypothetical protein KKE30_01210 [Gammaproteobacteria bacterium]|nr:hypothetical protein [Gammaproteobacteria bacterium]MBU1553585.1 hypothetical protein [Gammaproteobacteria bacterium]MBU2070591.1 hypothetical protein [Gammaproteobacteria bacterium]MBU2181987.1 hypothetical protein [Gammaproteobacteria bacterium]MBU2207097.1 hypothetical protein [Gammaproteobacteria bacterium]